MGASLEVYFHAVMSGKRRSIDAAILRAAARAIEPIYAAAMTARNKRFDTQKRAIHHAAKPVISIGNITTGGTGKTPVVRWLAAQLRRADQHPAILMRGYRRNRAGISDEQELLDSQLNRDPALPPIIVEANPDRAAGAKRALTIDPHITCFILDDGMQHRQLHRDLNIVLISAMNPFGYGHVFPRGLLREPLKGLSRADVILLTHASEISEPQREEMKQQLRQFSSAPILSCDHLLSGFQHGDAMLPLESLKDKPYIAICGIGSPHAFFDALRQAGGNLIAAHALDDHHDFTFEEIQIFATSANRAAGLLIVTEKDWMKIKHLAGINQIDIAIWRAQLSLKFAPGDEANLMTIVSNVIGHAE